MRWILCVVFLYGFWSPPSTACSRIVFPFMEYGSPLIVEVTIRSVSGNLAEVEVHDVLLHPTPPPALPLQVLIAEVGYGASCENWLGEASLSVGERAFLMLIENTLSPDARWRPYGNYAEGIRLIRGDRVYSSRTGDWVDMGSTDDFREQVRQGPHLLQVQAQEESSRNALAACSSGDAQACRLQARMVGATDQGEGTALLQKACALDDPEGCLQYGLVLLGEKVNADYDSVPADAADVAHHISADCDAGDAEACRVKARALQVASKSD
jgi:hypothetical protein